MCNVVPVASALLVGAEEEDSFVPAACETATGMHDGKAEDGENDHGAVEDHEQDLVVSHVTCKTFA